MKWEEYGVISKHIHDKFDRITNKQGYETEIIRFITLFVYSLKHRL